MIERVPYSDEEANEAWLWVGRHGPANAWTASNGTAARMIGRLLEERERLLEQLTLTDAEREAVKWAIVAADLEKTETEGKFSAFVAERAATLRTMLERLT